MYSGQAASTDAVGPARARIRAGQGAQGRHRERQWLGQGPRGRHGGGVNPPLSLQAEAQCLGPAMTPETDPTIIIWEKPELSLTTLLGIVQSSVVIAAWSQHCMHKLNPRDGRPSWDQFLAMWVKVLSGWK